MKRRIADGTRSFSDIVTLLGDSEFADAELTVAKTNAANRNKFIDYVVGGVGQVMPQGLVYYTNSSDPIIVPPPPPPPPPPPVTSFPDSTNTGYKNYPGFEGSLANFSGQVKSGQVYENLFFPGGVLVGERGNPVEGVTFRGCRFAGSGSSSPLALLYGDGVKFDFCSFDPGSAAPPVSYSGGYQYAIEADGGWYTAVEELTVTNCDIWGFANAIDVTGGTQAKPHVYRGNWIHDARNDGGKDHTDGIGALSGGGRESYLVIDNNTIESHGNTNAIAYQGGTYSNLTITNNLLGGFGYSVMIVGSPLTNVEFTDNTFSTRVLPFFGPLYSDAFVRASGSVWARNKWMVPDGAAWGIKEHDGWFWMPVVADRNGSLNDSQFVSQSDFAG